MFRGLIDHHLLEQEEQSPTLCSCCYYVANKVVCVCVCGPAAAVYTSIRATSKSPALARDSQHRTNRGSKPHAHGSQRSEWPICQVQTRTPEIQEQGTACATKVILSCLKPSSFKLGDVSVFVCVCLDSAKDPEPTVEGAVWPASVWRDRWGARDHGVGQRHWKKGRFHWAVSLYLCLGDFCVNSTLFI